MSTPLSISPLSFATRSTAALPRWSHTARSRGGRTQLCRLRTHLCRLRARARTAAGAHRSTTAPARPHAHPVRARSLASRSSTCQRRATIRTSASPTSLSRRESWDGHRRCLFAPVRRCCRPHTSLPPLTPCLHPARTRTHAPRARTRHAQGLRKTIEYFAAELKETGIFVPVGPLRRDGLSMTPPPPVRTHTQPHTDHPLTHKHTHPHTHTHTHELTHNARRRSTAPGTPRRCDP